MVSNFNEQTYSLRIASKEFATLLHERYLGK
jgi:hypothetical protein